LGSHFLTISLQSYNALNNEEWVVYPAMMWNGLSTSRVALPFTVFWPRRTRGAAPDCS